MRLVLVVAAALAAAAAPARAEGPARWWSFDVPAGWTDITANLADQHADLRERFTAIGTVEVFQAHGSPDGATQILVYETRIPGAHDSVRRGLASFESGARDGVKRSATEVRYAQREDGNALVVDQVVNSPDGQQLIIRRIEGVDRRRAYASLVATCAGDEATCTALLLGVRFDQAALLPLETMLPGRGGGGGTIDTESSAYQAGHAVGTMLGVGFMIWLVVRWRRRKRGEA